MKASEAESNTQQTITATKHSGAKYFKVRDGRKQPIRGLWQRNDRFYARLKVEDASGKSALRWIPLVDENEQPLDSVAKAKAALEKLKVRREDNKLPVFGETPKFSDFVDSYFQYYKQVKDAKRASTLRRENGPLKEMEETPRRHPATSNQKGHITSFIAKRQGAGLSARAVSLDVIALRNVLKKRLTMVGSRPGLMICQMIKAD